MLRRWIVRLCVAAVVLLTCAHPDALAADVPLAIETERQFANAVLPALKTSTTVRCSAKTAFGSSLGGCPHPLTYLRSEVVMGQGPRLVLIWFVRAQPGSTPPNFVCDDCPSWVLVALVESHDGEVVVRAVSGSLMSSNGRELWVPGEPIAVAGTDVFPVDKTYRKRGFIRRDRHFWLQKKTKLQLVGTVPVYGSNEGVCGRLQDVVHSKKTFGGKDTCGNVWRFDAEVSRHSKGILVKETLLEASRPKFVQNTARRDISYVWKNHRLVAPKRSLFPQ